MDVIAREHLTPRERGLDEGPEEGGCCLNTGVHSQWASGLWPKLSILLVPSGPVSLSSMVPLLVGSWRLNISG